MEWIDGMNQAMDYIESHLTEEVKLERLARMAACSEFHFQRMFAFLTGVALGEYIRRRKLSTAALELWEGAKVIDVAVKYGYDSPTAFARAFRQLHGVAPSEAKKEGVPLNIFPKFTFTFSVKGEQAMHYKIITKEAFRIVGYKFTEPMTMENSFEIVPEIWKKVYAANGIEKLAALMQGQEPQGILGVSTCENGAYGAYFIAVATSAPVPDGMEAYQMPRTTYAVFQCAGPLPDAMQSVQRRVVSEWLPSSGYEYAPAPDIEVYPAGNQQSPDYRSEVWLPIVKGGSER